MWKRHCLFCVFFSLLGVAQENCTTRSSYVQYSTPQQATGFSMALIMPLKFLGGKIMDREEFKKWDAMGRKCGQVKASWLGWGWGWGWGLRHRIDCNRWGSRGACCSRRWHCHRRAASSAWPAGSRSDGVRVSSGGRSAWIACRTGGSRTSSHPCGCDSAVPAHQSERTSYCSQARCRERGALLWQTQRKQNTQLLVFTTHIHDHSDICDVFKTDCKAIQALHSSQILGQCAIYK